MNIDSTHRFARQVKYSQPRNIDIDAMLRQMAKADGYDARKLPLTDHMLNSPRFDTAPCESEPQEEPATAEWVPESQEEKDYFSACVVCLCIFAGVALAVIAWATN